MVECAMMNKYEDMKMITNMRRGVDHSSICLSLLGYSIE